MIRAIAFDLDGTLIDSGADIAAAANHALSRAGLPTLSLATIRGFVGDGSRVLLERASGLQGDDSRFAPLMADFLEYYSQHPVDHTTLLPGAREVLEQVGARYHLALCTNKPRSLTLPVLEGLELAKHFEAVVAAGDVPQTKPHPAPLQKVAALLGLACSELVLVGDGPQDIGCAQAAGCRSIGVSDAVILPLSRLLATDPDACVPLSKVPEVLAKWQGEA